MRRTDPATVSRIRELRELGLSLKDVAAWTGVAPSTAHVHSRDIPPPPRDRWRPATRRTKGSLHTAKLAQIAECDAWAAERLPALSDDAFFAAGVALYAGEGSKTEGSATFANTDPAIVRFYVTWLRRYFEIDESRLRVRVYLHEDLDLHRATEFWSCATGVPIEQFRAPYRAIADPATMRRRRHAYGCVYVRYSCTRTLRRILALCDVLLGSVPADPA